MTSSCSTGSARRPIGPAIPVTVVPPPTGPCALIIDTRSADAFSRTKRADNRPTAGPPAPRGASEMKRRTLDILFGTGGLVFALLLLIVGIVLTSNANFAKNYVSDQLSQQNISFKTADTLTPEEKAEACLVTYAGQKMTTGKQAECYANNFIGLHV